VPFLDTKDEAREASTKHASLFDRPNAAANDWYLRGQVQKLSAWTTSAAASRSRVRNVRFPAAISLG
jgi:hypothetical protein